MSADNGIYILTTPKGSTSEYRVAHVQAIEDIYWNEKTKKCDNEDGNPEQVVAVFNNTQVFNIKEDAMKFATDFYQSFDYVEYGISYIDLPHEFNWYENKCNINNIT